MLIPAEEWLLTEGNQFVVVGEFRRDNNGKVQFVNRKREPIPLPVWAVTNMLEAYASVELGLENAE